MRLAAVVAAGWILAAAGLGQAVYSTTPDWVSSDTPVSTGGALFDVDRDGWLDLVVANGNDMAQEHVAVYYNQGDGTYPPTPNWQSGDAVYNGHLAVADVNGDGWLDVAVATLGNGGTTGPIARVYLNNAGTLSSTPDWSADVAGNAFDVAFGDVNNDGRPDLAVGTGWAYSPQHYYHNYVYLNVGGALEASASWVSDDTHHYQGVLWVDADEDGWLDLVGAAARAETRLYRNLGGTLETSASWSTTDSGAQDAIMAAAGDVDGDGRRELFVTDNFQLGGTGRFRQYDGLAGGFFSTTYSWSHYGGYGSALTLADVDADGTLDLATGAWWGETKLFFNNGSGFDTGPDWTSDTEAVTEKILFGDIDKKGLRTAVETFPTAPVAPHLFYLAHQPIQRIVAVRRNGVDLSPAEYTFSREHGWVSVGPAVGGVEVEYTVSSRLDMAVTNWDADVGNYVFYNRAVRKGDVNCDGRVNSFDIDPFVLLLADRPTYDASWPDCDADTNGDMNDDAAINSFDIDPFVEALTR